MIIWPYVSVILLFIAFIWFYILLFFIPFYPKPVEWCLRERLPYGRRSCAAENDHRLPTFQRQRSDAACSIFLSGNQWQCRFELAALLNHPWPMYRKSSGINKVYALIGGCSRTVWKYSAWPSVLSSVLPLVRWKLTPIRCGADSGARINTPSAPLSVRLAAVVWPRYNSQVQNNCGAHAVSKFSLVHIITMVVFCDIPGAAYAYMV